MEKQQERINPRNTKAVVNYFTTLQTQEKLSDIQDKLLKELQGNMPTRKKRDIAEDLILGEYENPNILRRYKVIKTILNQGYHYPDLIPCCGSLVEAIKKEKEQNTSKGGNGDFVALANQCKDKLLRYVEKLKTDNINHKMGESDAYHSDDEKTTQNFLKNIEYLQNA